MATPHSLRRTTPAERRAIARQLRQMHHALDPVSWATERLGIDLWSMQREICRALLDHRRVVVRSAQDVGKSLLAAVLALWWIDTHPAGTAFVVTTAPTRSQVESILWREMRQLHARGGLEGSMNETEWKIGGHLVAHGLKPADHDPSALQGIHARYVLVVMDEAGGIAAPLWSAAETLMANEGSRIIAIGNPDDPTSQFARVSAPGSGWHTIRIDGYASPNFTAEAVSPELAGLLLSQSWVEERRGSWGENSPLFTSKVRGEFPDESEDTLIPIGWIRVAMDRFEQRPVAAEVLGVDVARYGSDETVIVARSGEVAWIVGRYRRQDTMETTGRVVRALKDLGAATARVDVVGIGSGVVDRLRELDHDVDEMNAGTSARHEDRFVNSRAEWHWTLRDHFEREEIVLEPDDELVAQLSSLRYRVDSRGRIQIESKDDARSRGISSPDIADALMLAFAPGRAKQINFAATFAQVNDSFVSPSPWRDRTW